MTNNHCPDIPAMIRVSRATEVRTREFAEHLQSLITEFAETESMDEMMILDPRITDSWNECPRCEVKVCDIQHKAYGKLIKEIMELLNSEF